MPPEHFKWLGHGYPTGVPYYGITRSAVRQAARRLRVVARSPQVLSSSPGQGAQLCRGERSMDGDPLIARCSKF